MTKSEIIVQLGLHKQKSYLNYGLKRKTEHFTDTLFHLLFDAQTPVKHSLDEMEVVFEELTDMARWTPPSHYKKVWQEYLASLPEILKKLNRDAHAIVNGDPAALSLQEVYLAYPGFYAIVIYRLAHELYKKEFPLVPRLMTEYAHRQTGVDINPGAQIGDSFFIDHGTGVVIGETAVIKDHVKIYQGVTLGALHVSKNLTDVKRHPTIESNVTIYANATILGGDTIVGENSIIGGNAWITASIPANSTVFHNPEIKIKTEVNV